MLSLSMNLCVRVRACVCSRCLIKVGCVTQELWGSQTVKADMRGLMGLAAFIAKGHKSQKLQILPSKTMMKQAKIAQSSIVWTKVVCYLCVAITF